MSAPLFLPGISGLLSPTECDRHLGLYRDGLELGGGTVALFALPTKQCFASGDLAQIRERAMAWSDGTRDVYIHTHLHSLAPGDHVGRGSIRTATVAIGLVSDIDAWGPKRKKPRETLCPTVADALSIPQEFTKLYGPESVIIESGHGCYPLILFREPLVIVTDGDRDTLNAIARRYHNALHRIAVGHGWPGAVDFCDMAKVIRLAGTLNGKDPAAPVAVRFFSEGPARYNISDLEEMLPEIASPSLFASGSVAATTKRPQAGHGLQLISRATPPSEQLIAALMEGPAFRDTWKHARADLKDQSCSSYDMALANIGVGDGLTDDQIAGLLVENRHRFPREKQDRQGKYYADYLTRTIGKARAAQPDAKPMDLSCFANPDPEAEAVEPLPASGNYVAADIRLGDSACKAGPEEPEIAADEVVAAVPPPTTPRPPARDNKEPIPRLVVLTTITKEEVVKRVSDRLIDGHHFARDAAERLYVYKDGIYVPCDFYVRRQTQILLEEAGLASKWSSHHGREVVQYTMLRAKELWGEPPRQEVNLLNGILDARSGQLRPHSPDFLSPIQIPVKYDPAAACPAWEKFIGEVFPEDSVELAWEILGDLITPDRSIQKAGLLVGEGGNGKGVFLAGCIAFVGLNNVSAVPLHKLETDRFSVSPGRRRHPVVAVVAVSPVSLPVTYFYRSVSGGKKGEGEREKNIEQIGELVIPPLPPLRGVASVKKREISVNKRFDIPLIPPMRGDGHATMPIPLAAGTTDNFECSVLDWCDQCGRGALRPHVVNARPYCRGCCPKCAQSESFRGRS